MKKRVLYNILTKLQIIKWKSNPTFFPIEMICKGCWISISIVYGNDDDNEDLKILGRNFSHDLNQI